MSIAKSHILDLSERLQKHEGVTHWAISMRLLGKGDFFNNLRKPERDLRMGTYERLLASFSNCWPDDLEWPAGVPRPSLEENAA